MGAEPWARMWGMRPSQPTLDQDGERSIDGDGLLRLLFVVPFGPRFDSKHGGRVIAQLLRQLAGRHEVAVVYQRLPHSAPMDEMLGSSCALVRQVPLVPAAPLGPQWQHQQRVMKTLINGRPTPVSAIYSRHFARIVRQLAQEWKPDVIQIEHDVLGYCIPELDMPESATVLVCHDPGLKAAKDLVAVTHGRRRLAHRLDVMAWRRYWARTLTRADAVVTFTEEDARSITDVAAVRRIVAIPLGIDLPAQPSDAAGVAPPRIVFIGGYVHPPNADAALRLMRSIMPAARRAMPDLQLTLVGERPTSSMWRAASADDEITGGVPSVAPYVDNAALIVLPIRLGGGMRVKLLEALAAGKAVIASPLAAAGLHVKDGEQLRIVETDEQFARTILELLDDEELRRGLGARARAWALENLGWDRRVALYEDLYRTLVETTRDRI